MRQFYSTPEVGMDGMCTMQDHYPQPPPPSRVEMRQSYGTPEVGMDSMCVMHYHYPQPLKG